MHNKSKLPTYLVHLFLRDITNRTEHNLGKSLKIIMFLMGTSYGKKIVSRMGIKRSRFFRKKKKKRPLF